MMLITDKIYIDELTRPRNLDEHWMRLAIKCAYEGSPMTKPNPLVGAVLVDASGQLIATGFHRSFGGIHAEVDVISKAMEKNVTLENATLYCTLEPCCHTEKKTPPCLPLVLKHKIKRVVIGSLDPNPQVSGKSIQQLKATGTEVTVGVLENACKFLIREFSHKQIHQRPYIHLKIAQSLDGSHGPTQGKTSLERWMTNDEAKDYVHQLRAVSDAVLIGGETYRQDKPQLTCRIPNITQEKNFKQPTKLLLSRTERPKQDDNYVVLTSLTELNTMSNYQRILVEAGPRLMSMLLEEKLVDELSIIMTPTILGNIQKLKFMKEYGLKDAIQFNHAHWIELNGNLLFHWVK